MAQKLFWVLLAIVLTNNFIINKSTTLESFDDEITKLIIKISENVITIFRNGKTKSLEQEQNKLITEYFRVFKKLSNIFDSNSEIEAKNYLEYILPEYLNMQNDISEIILNNDDSYKIMKLKFNFANNTRANLRSFNYKNFENKTLIRQLRVLTESKVMVLNEEIHRTYMLSLSDAAGWYTNICSYNNSMDCNLSYYKNIKNIISRSNDPKEIKYYWKQLREIESVETFLINFAMQQNVHALLNGYKNTSDQLYSKYSINNHIKKFEKVVNDLKPFYIQLHAYLRYSLRQKYGDTIVPEKQPIPEHIFDQLLSQVIMGNVDIGYPFPDKRFPNIANNLNNNFEMIGENLLRKSNEFFKSIGFSDLPNKFWTEHSKERNYNPNLYNKMCKNIVINTKESPAILYCPNVDFTAFLEMHSDMTKIHYHELNRKLLTKSVLDEPYPGFTRSIGKSIQLSVFTPNYLNENSYILNNDIDNEMNLNRLFLMSLYTILNIPKYFVYEKFWSNLIDLKYNFSNDSIKQIYWNMENHYRGVQRPTNTSSKNIDLSPDFFLTIDEPILDVLEYKKETILLDEILGFSIYKSLCKKSGQYIPGNSAHPLNKCNFYGNLEAGKILISIFSSNPTKYWHEIFEEHLGEDGLSASAILEYFEPLRIWIEEQNKKNNVFIGWDSPNDNLILSDD